MITETDTDMNVVRYHDHVNVLAVQMFLHMHDI